MVKCKTCGSTNCHGFEEDRIENLGGITIVMSVACNECGTEDWYRLVYDLTSSKILTPEERQRIIEKRRME